MGTTGYSRGTAGYWSARRHLLRQAEGHTCHASCTGAFVSGADGSNECPAGSVRIATEAACRTALTAAGKTASSPFVWADSYYPRGCYYWTSCDAILCRMGANFNTHAVGAGNPHFLLLCAAVLTGALPPAPMHFRAHRREQPHCARVQRRKGTPWYSKGAQGYSHVPRNPSYLSSPLRAQAAALRGSVWPTGVRSVSYGTVHRYSQGTPGVLMGYCTGLTGSAVACGSIE